MARCIIAVVALFMAAGLLSACGNASDNPADSAPVAKALTGQLAPGTYTTSLSTRDVHPQMVSDLPLSGVYVGRWKLSFGGQGQFNASRNGNPVFEAEYSLVPDGIIFSGKAWSDYCAGQTAESRGVYNLILKDGTLLLQAQEENCAFRQLLLTAHPLIFNAGNNPPAFTDAAEEMVL